MKKLINKANIFFQQFMYGRYGFDQLYKFSIIINLSSFLILSIIGRHINRYFYLIAYICVSLLWLYSLYRPFSKNISKRQNENIKYLNLIYKVRKQIKYIKNKIRFRKSHILKKCPKCKAVLRLKKKKGKHSITCPYCNTTFSFKTHFNVKE